MLQPQVYERICLWVAPNFSQFLGIIFQDLELKLAMDLPLVRHRVWQQYRGKFYCFLATSLLKHIISQMIFFSKSLVAPRQIFQMKFVLYIGFRSTSDFCRRRLRHLGNVMFLQFAENSRFFSKSANFFFSLINHIIVMIFNLRKIQVFSEIQVFVIYI